MTFAQYFKTDILEMTTYINMIGCKWLSLVIGIAFVLTTLCSYTDLCCGF